MTLTLLMSVDTISRPVTWNTRPTFLSSVFVTWIHRCLNTANDFMTWIHRCLKSANDLSSLFVTWIHRCLNTANDFMTWIHRCLKSANDLTKTWRGCRLVVVYLTGNITDESTTKLLKELSVDNLMSRPVTWNIR